MKMHLNSVLAIPLALALAVSATIPIGSGSGLNIDARGSSSTRADQRIALAALDPIVDAALPCVFRGSYCDPQVPCCARYQYWYGNVSGDRHFLVERTPFLDDASAYPRSAFAHDGGFVVTTCVTSYTLAESKMG